MPFTLAIVGRPNVGKSTLFNRLVGRRLALVDDQPGVTRDLREGAGRLGALRFTVVDTAGLEEVTDASLSGRMRALTERAVDAADVCLFMIDARVGVTAVDRTLAELLRRRAARVILVANKAEGRAAEAGLIEAWELGLGRAGGGVGGAWDGDGRPACGCWSRWRRGFRMRRRWWRSTSGRRSTTRSTRRARGRRCRRGGRSRSRWSGGRTRESPRLSMRYWARIAC